MIQPRRRIEKRVLKCLRGRERAWLERKCDTGWRREPRQRKTRLWAECYQTPSWMCWFDSRFAHAPQGDGRARKRYFGRVL